MKNDSFESHADSSTNGLALTTLIFLSNSELGVPVRKGWRKKKLNKFKIKKKNPVDSESILERQV